MAVGAAVPLLVLSIILYGEGLADLMVECWTNPAASQGLLIPPLAAYLAYLRRDMITARPAKVEYAGLLMVAAAALLLVVGRLAAEFFLIRISFVLVLAGLLWTFWGAARLRVLALPLLLLATMIPLPAIVYGSLSGPLQLFASEAAAALTEFVGVTVYRDGNLIHLANLTLGVEEACSGLTSLSCLLIAGLLLGYVLCRRPVVRLGVFCSAVPVAIFANILRIAGTAVLSDRHPAYALGFYHAFSGWIVFVVGFLCLYGIATILRRWSE
jgi:exosortase